MAEGNPDETSFEELPVCRPEWDLLALVVQNCGNPAFVYMSGWSIVLIGMRACPRYLSPPESILITKDINRLTLYRKRTEISLPNFKVRSPKLGAMLVDSSQCLKPIGYFIMRWLVYVFDVLLHPIFYGGDTGQVKKRTNMQQIRRNTKSAVHTVKKFWRCHCGIRRPLNLAREKCACIHPCIHEQERTENLGDLFWCVSYTVVRSEK